MAAAAFRALGISELAARLPSAMAGLLGVVAVFWVGRHWVSRRCGLAAALILILTPLDITDPGFVLTFGATMALVEGVQRGAELVPAGLRNTTRPRRRWMWSWVVATVLGSLAVEAVLLPVSALQFSRVTSAGLLLNLLAVPAMGGVQVAAMVVTVANEIPWLAFSAGWVAHRAADALLSSANLVTQAPWLAARVPPPTFALVLVYYVALLGALTTRRGWRTVSGLVLETGRKMLVSTP